MLPKFPGLLDAIVAWCHFFNALADVFSIADQQSRRNLEMAGGRELSRHQLFHLQLKGEYIDDADFGNGHDYEGTILPLMDTTMPTTAEDPHLERLREEEERAEQEIIFENYTNTFEDYSVELKGDD